MCWKNEWAKAINNLEWAKIHIERAAIKTEKRGLKDAAMVSHRIIKILKHNQLVLEKLIEDFGISRKENAASLQKHMKGQRKKQGKIRGWVSKN